MSQLDHRMWMLVEDEITRMVAEGVNDVDIKVRIVKLTHGLILPDDIQRAIIRIRTADWE